jgi:predicted nucleic acid-binding protein
MTTAYVDASALVKLALDEPDGIAMRHWYHEHERIASSRIGVVETHRAVRRKVDDMAHVDAILRSIQVMEVDMAIAARASSVGPIGLRTLDAIHLATAIVLGPELDAFVTYDDRLADAARALGLPVVRPA